MGIYSMAGGGIPPLRPSWSPDYHIDGTSGFTAAVWPDTTTIYICTVTDSIGCESNWGNKWTITVDTFPTGLYDIGNRNSHFSPNPVSNALHLDIDVQDIQYHVFDLMGKQFPVLMSDNNIDVSTLEPGMYILYLKCNKGVIIKKFIKK